MAETRAGSPPMSKTAQRRTAAANDTSCRGGAPSNAKANQLLPAAKHEEPNSETNAVETPPDAGHKTLSEVTPRLVERIHELYEELGREEVEAVQAYEKSELQKK